MSTLRYFLAFFSLLAALVACAFITPATPAPKPTCPPPPCPAGTTLTCPLETCPDNCDLMCDYAPAPITPPVTAGPARPQAVCTPPPCWSNESYFCAGECPGGCGTTCATHTPNPAASAVPFPEPLCELTAPGGLATPGQAASLLTCAETADLPAGAVWQVWGVALNFTAPIYTVEVVDAAGKEVAYARLAPTNRTRDVFAQPNLKLEALLARDNRVYMAARFVTPGAYTLRLTALSSDFTVSAEAVSLAVTVR